MDLKQWLHRPDDYAVGLKLLATHEPDHPLKSMLIRVGPTRYNRKKLYSILEQVIEESTGVVPAFTHRDVNYQPAAIQDLHKEWKPLFKSLHAKKLGLKHVQDPEVRRRHCLEIVRGFKEVIIPTWDMIDTWSATGKLPPPKQEVEEPDLLHQLTPLTPAQQWGVRQLQLIPPRMTKAKKRGQTTKAEELQELLASIKEKLNAR